VHGVEGGGAGAAVEVVSVRGERLEEMAEEDVGREGFEGETAAWFVAFFL